MHTQRHTSGCACYIINDVMFTGDTLFKNNVGRTDMLDDNYDDLKESLQKISKITENYRILPGNLNETTLNSEKRSNCLLSLTNEKNLFDF